LTHHAVRRNPGALDSISQVLRLLTLGVEALHSVLNFVQGLLLSVEALDADEVEGVADKVRLD